MVDLSIPEDIRMVGDSLIRFVEAEVVPLEQANRDLLTNARTLYDETGRFAPRVLDLRRQVRRASAAAGFYTMLGPEELGGAGLGAVATVYLHDLLGSVYGPGRVLIHPVVMPSSFTNGLSPVLTALDPAVRARVLPDIASGEKTLCFALSEPDAGSDVFGIRTRAVRDGDHWIVTGTKQWITNGPHADYVMVFAVTDPDRVAARTGGITGFLVDACTPGFSVSSVIPVMGQIGGDTAILSFDGVRVPDQQRLGGVGDGLAVALRGINAGRLGLAATCLGLARWGLRQALEYARTRKTFGKPIGEHQAVQGLLAEAAMDVYAAQGMILNCAWKVQAGRPARMEISMVKAYATEMLNRVMDHCIQVHGGMGLTNDLRLEEGYRFARAMRIPDGTGEMQRRTIARDLLYRDAQIAF